MDGMDLGGAYGAGGAGDALQKILAQRMAAKQFAEAQRQALAKESLGRDTLAENSQYRMAQQAATAEQRAARQQQYEEANRLREENNFRQNAPPPGTEIPYDQQASYRHFGMGNLLNTQQQPTPDTTGQDFSGPLNQHTILMPSAKQAAEAAKLGEGGNIERDAQGNFLRIGKDNIARPTHTEAGGPQKGYQAPPSFIAVQTDKGPAFADPKHPDAPVHPMKTKEGAFVSPALTASTRTMMEGAKMVAPHIPEIRSQAQALDKAGLFGPMMSRVRAIATKAGSVDDLLNLANAEQDPAVGQFATSLALLASGAARVHYGGRAGSSTGVVQTFKDMTSDAGTLALFEGRLKGLESFIEGYAKGPNSGGQAAPNDPLGIR